MANAIPNSDAAREAARAVDGKFGTQEHGRPENGLQVTPPFIQELPSGGSVELEEMPDVSAMEPAVRTRDNGMVQITYIKTEEWPDADGIDSVSDSLRQCDIATYGPHDDAYNAIREHCDTTGDLSRVVMLTKSTTRPGEYEARVLGNDFFMEGGDTNDWKDADGALIFPTDRNAEEEVDGWMEDINTVGRDKKTYTVVSELRSPDGVLVDSLYDDHDGTFTAEDAHAWAADAHNNPIHFDD